MAHLFQRHTIVLFSVMLKWSGGDIGGGESTDVSVHTGPTSRSHD